MTATPQVLSASDYVVALDYGQFSLETTEYVTYGDEDPSLLEQAQLAGIAQLGSSVLVMCPHQNDFSMKLRVEQWSAPPVDDVGDWQDAYEVSLVVGESGIDFDSPTMGPTKLTVPPGTYRCRITGRGFIASGWPGTTDPGGQYRLQLWLDDRIAEPMVLQRWAPEVAEARPRQFLEAGRDALARNNRAMLALLVPEQLRRTVRVGSDRALAEALHASAGHVARSYTGVAAASCTYRASRRKTWPFFLDVSGWTGSMGGSNNVKGVGLTFGLSHFNDADDLFDRLPVGPTCDRGCEPYWWFSLEGTVTDLKRPAWLELELQWKLTTERFQPSPRERRERAILSAPTVAHIALTETKSDEGDALCTVQVTHTGLPPEWADDLTRLWECKLEAAEQFGLPRA